MTKSYPPLGHDNLDDLGGLNSNPIRQFQLWLEEAKAKGVLLPEAMCLSTVGKNNHPEGRMLLLKGIDDRGFVFYTNLHSPKALSLSSHPQAALTFYWEKTRRQVRIVGGVEPVTPQEADAYFATRPRDSQIGAWASLQSQVLETRGVLEKRFSELQQQYEGRIIPRPPHWSGYRLIPSEIEFWTEKPSRLHDRFLYSREDSKSSSAGGWKIQRLYP
jgi:pyridoxamine 5'-phosphate oxidase